MDDDDAAIAPMQVFQNMRRGVLATVVDEDKLETLAGTLQSSRQAPIEFGQIFRLIEKRHNHTRQRWLIAPSCALFACHWKTLALPSKPCSAGNTKADRQKQDDLPKLVLLQLASPV